MLAPLGSALTHAEDEGQAGQCHRGPTADHADEELEERIEQQRCPEQPVDQSPGPPWGHQGGLWEDPCPVVFLLKGILEGQRSASDTVLVSRCYLLALWTNLMQSALWAATVGISSATWHPLPPVTPRETATAVLPVCRREELKLGVHQPQSCSPYPRH